MIGPRLNAAGRLTDMSAGIECLLSEDSARAAALARELDALNRERRGIEADMQDAALLHLEDLDPGDAWGLSLYDPAWHQGVIGILAARMRERFHRPVIAFAPGKDGELKGSGRSIQSLHLRDALDLVDKQHPGLLLRFGGHAAAAGLSIRESDFARFREAFDATLRTLLTLDDLEQRIETDGELASGETTLPLAEQISKTVWGQGFPPPRFRGRFRVAEQRLVGGKHRSCGSSRSRRVHLASCSTPCSSARMHHLPISSTRCIASMSTSGTASVRCNWSSSTGSQ